MMLLLSQFRSEELWGVCGSHKIEEEPIIQEKVFFELL